MTHSTIAAAADLFEVSARDILSESRSAHLVRARQAVMYVLWQQGMGLKAAAAAVGRNDHTTALRALEQVQDRMAVNAHYAKQVTALMDGRNAGLHAAARALLDGAVPFGRQALVDAALLDALREAL